MKKVYYITTYLLFIFPIFIVEAYDFDYGKSPQAVPTQENGPLLRTTEDVVNLVEGIRNWLFAIFLIVAVISFLIAAFQFITSGGDSERVKKAKEMIKYGIYGVVIALLAGGMVEIIRSVLNLGAGG